MKARKNGVRGPLLARLREGPLPTDAFQGLCNSRPALTVNIYLMRKQGYAISTRWQGNSPGVYILTGEP